MRRTKQITPFGMKIKAELMMQNMTAKDLAARIGKSDVTISDVMSGKNKSEETKRLIMQELGLKVG